MNIEHLYFFTAVVQQGSLTKAATKLGVSPQTVGRKIAQLESQIGCQLFVRHPTGYQPTVDGLSLHKQAQEIEEVLAAFKANFSTQNTSFSGVVRVALPEMIALQCVIPQIQPFLQRYPDLELQMVTGIHTVGIAKGDADIALRLKRPNKGALTVRKIGLMSSGLFVSHSLRDQPLDSVPLIGWDRHTQLPAVQWLKKITDREPILRFNTLAAQQAAIRSGLGAGILPHFLSEGLSEMSAYPIPLEPLWLVTHSNMTTPRVRAVYDEIAAIIGANQAQLVPNQPDSSP
ncbi:LysR family transcriptional regulator [Vibrio ostreicida]|uniref:LysR family transcriptional regulator n=1 Tax=Vibrio ostreicida TaxID=526588 RepID=UPI00097097F4|nr:LysR family transcriptional regulator [Vibrio ostreicida]